MTEKEQRGRLIPRDDRRHQISCEFVKKKQETMT